MSDLSTMCEISDCEFRGFLHKHDEFGVITESKNISIHAEYIERIKQLESEVMLLKERLGPAGYKMLLRLKDLESKEFREYILALEAVAKVAEDFNFTIQPDDKNGVAAWIDIEEVRNMNQVMERLEQAKKAAGK